MQTSREILEIIERENLNVQEIARKSHIKASRIYKWLSGKGSPKEEDSAKLRQWATENLEQMRNGKNSKSYSLDLNSNPTQVAENSIKYSTFSDLLLALIEKQNHLMEMQNQILKDQRENVVSNLIDLKEGQKIIQAYQVATTYHLGQIRKGVGKVSEAAYDDETNKALSSVFSEAEKTGKMLRAHKDRRKKS